MRKMVMTVAVAAAALTLITAPAGAQIGEADREFVRKAAEGGVMEVELGRLAGARATSDAVRQFGQRMVTDHGMANQELMRLAEQKGVTLPASLSPEHQALRDRLGGLAGAEFDRAYMDEMVKDHREDVALFERQAQSAQDPDLRAFAGRTLPVLREHLRLAQDVHSRVALAAPAPAAAVRPAAPAVPWCAGAYAPDMGTNFGTCPP
jgi:putative membrane protein